MNADHGFLGSYVRHLLVSNGQNRQHTLKSMAERPSLIPGVLTDCSWQSTARRFLNWPPVKQSFKQR